MDKYSKAKDNLNETNKDCIEEKRKFNPFSAETIYLKEKFSKEITFLQDCMTEIKLNEYEKVENPKISIIIPVYKTESNINRLMQSIQKQLLKEIEDFSKKKKYPKLSEISKIDKRIKIFKNDINNKGLLNSYMKGIVNVRSKYMIFLEEEGMLLPYLEEIFNLIDNYEKDINNFSYLKGTFNGITNDEKANDEEKIQPEISKIYYNENFINENPLLNKVFKSNFVINATKNINEFYLSEKFDLHVDSLLYVCLCTYAQTYKSFQNLYSAYHFKNEFKKTKENVEIMFNSTLYLVQYIYDLKYINQETFNQRCMLVINLFNWPLNYNIKLNIDVKKANRVISMFFNNKDINELIIFQPHKKVAYWQLKHLYILDFLDSKNNLRIV